MPFEVPEGWEWVRLGEICDYGVCESINPLNLQDFDWVLDLEDIEKDTGVLLQRIVRKDRITTSTRHVFKKGDVLYSKLRTYLNKVLVADKDGYCTTEILPLDFKGYVLSEYARYALMSNMFLSYTAQCVYGVKMPRFGTNDGKNAPFPLPPLLEQQRIVTEIEKYYTVIDAIENSKSDLQITIQQTKQKILDLAIRGKLVPQNPNDEPVSFEETKGKSKTSDIFPYPFEVPESWIWAKFGAIAKHNTGKTLDRSKIEGVLYKYITTSNLYWNDFDFTELREMPFQENELEKYTIKKGDLLICEGGDAGRAAIWKSENSICFQNHIHRVRPLVGVEAEYLYYFIQLIYLNGEIKQYLKGIGIQSLSGRSLSSIIIPLPPVLEQKRIVALIENIFSQLDQIEEALKA